MDARNIGYWLQRIYHDLAGSTMVYMDARSDTYWLQQIYKELTGIDLVGDQRSFDWWSEAIYRHIIGDSSSVRGTVPANVSWQLIYASRASAAYPDGSSALSVEFWIQQAQRVGLESSAPVIPWYLLAGVTPVIAYQPKGAASLATSYINLPNPGTFDVAPGVAPTWNTVTGWTFNGTTQYLENGLTLNRPLTILLRASLPATSNGAFVNTAGTSGLTGLALGIGTTFSGSDDILTALANLVAWLSTGIAANLAGFTFGATFDTTGNAYALYVDGVQAVSGVSNLLATAGVMRIGNTGLGGVDPAFSMQALAAWDSVLTAPQVAAVAVAMAAL